MSGFILRGQVHPLDRANDFSGGARTFTVLFPPDIFTNEEAIKKAKEDLQEEERRVKDGEFIVATLCWDDRPIKDFPDEEVHN